MQVHVASAGCVNSSLVSAWRQSQKYLKFDSRSRDACGSVRHMYDPKYILTKPSNSRCFEKGKLALTAVVWLQAALDVFNQEPPPPDSPLVNRADVVCTPHLGASTTEAQEGVAVEIADAVIGALKVTVTSCSAAGTAAVWLISSPA